MEHFPPPAARKKPPGHSLKASDATIHIGRALPFEPGPLRAECWSMLGETVRDVLLRNAGPPIEWWAAVDGLDRGRANAVVLGHRGLYFADAGIDGKGQVEYTVTGCVLEPGSVTQVPVVHLPDRPRGTRKRDPKSPEGKKITGLSDAACGTIGNLPSRAQRLVQDPFLAGEEVLRCGWHYEGGEDWLDLFVLVLAGRRHITAAFGTKTVPAGHDTETAHWHLQCLRARVLRHVGMV